METGERAAIRFRGGGAEPSLTHTHALRHGHMRADSSNGVLDTEPNRRRPADRAGRPWCDMPSRSAASSPPPWGMPLIACLFIEELCLQLAAECLSCVLGSERASARMGLRNSSVVLALVLAVTCSVAVAYDPLDPNGNITIKWDVISWTPDGYVAMVTMNNYQMYRQIMAPGWTVGWSWAKKEVIWSIVGAQATEQGDCSKFKGGIPHCCKRTPAVVDLLPGVPYNQQIANCCKAGVVAAYGQDPAASVSAFQVSVGLAGTTNKTVKLPKNFTLMGPGLGYTCGPARVVPSTVYFTPDRRRKTQALMTWTVTCTYSQQLASRYPSCCVSFSSFYNDTIVPCAKCACGCGHHGGAAATKGGKRHGGGECIMGDSKRALAAGVNTPRKDGAPLLQCTSHMCPIRVHWHVKLNYKDYWRAKIAITNFNYRMNYTQWTLVAQHPNLDNVTEVFSFQYKPLLPYGTINDTGMFYGLKFYNDLLMEAGPFGNVQSEVLMRKDARTFTFSQGWAFPRKIYFNGDECKMPPPDSYPYLPNSAPVAAPPRSRMIAAAASSLLLMLILVAC